MKLAKMREDSKARRLAFPFLRALSPTPEPEMPSTSSSVRDRRPSTSKTKKEPAPEVLEMRRQFQAVREQLGPLALAKKVRDEKKEKDRWERRVEAKKKEAEAKARSAAQELAAAGTSRASRLSEMQQDPWHRQTLVPQQHKTTAADLASKDRIRFMTYKDKCQLTRDLSQLPEKKLGGIVRILRSREPRLRKVTNHQLEVNLDTLKLATLWELKEYVTSCQEKGEQQEDAVASTSKALKDVSLSEAQAQAQAQTQSDSESEWEYPSSSDSDF